MAKRNAYKSYAYRVETLDRAGNVTDSQLFCSQREISDVYGLSLATIQKNVVREGGEPVVPKYRFIKLDKRLPVYGSVRLDYSNPEEITLEE